MLEHATATFTVESSIWRTVDRWADEYGYRLVEWHATSRVYEKSHRMLRGYGRWRVEIEEAGHHVDVEAEVRFRPLSPPGPGRDGFLLKAREEVNALLADLGQPPLD
jgi:hypothetical protein